MSRPLLRHLLAALAAVAMLVAVRAWAEGGALGDPTRPTALNEVTVQDRAVSRAPRWRLQSTLVAADRRIAVINGRQLRLGESVDGATVVDIRAEGVTLQVDRLLMDLRLHPQSASIRKGAN